MSQTPSTDSAPAGRPGWIWYAGAVLTALALINPPSPPSGDLDSSWQAVLSNAHLANRQFGTEVVFTGGPWGWIVTASVLPEAVVGKWVWELLGKLALVGAVALTGRILPWGRRWLLLAGLALLGRMFPDTLPTLALVLLVGDLLFRRTTAPWVVAVALGLLGLLAQIKFSFALLGGGGVGLAIASLAWQGAPRRAAWIGGGFALAYLGWWIAGGQALGHLPAYWSTSWEIARGYGSAMSFDETPAVFALGVSALGLAGVWLVAQGVGAADRPRQWPLLAFMALAGWLTWQHGFIRADGHVLGFFALTLLVGTFLPCLLHPERRWSWLDLNLPLCLAGLFVAYPEVLRDCVPSLPRQLRTNVDALRRLPAATATLQAAGKPAAQTAAFTLSGVREAVGSGSIDALGHEQGGLLLLGLDYRPRPVFQSYFAFTEPLLRLNRDYFAGPAAPEFALLRLGSIDGRFPMQDDALAVLELRQRYAPALLAQGYALLRRSASPPPALQREEASPLAATWNQTVPLPPPAGVVWQLEVHAELSLLGRLRAAAYKPPQLAMVVTDSDGRQRRHRLIPAIAASGFVIQPLVETQRALNAFFAGEATRWTRAVRIEPATPSDQVFWGRLQLRLVRLPGLAARASGAPFQTYVDRGFFNRPPLEIESAVNVAPSDADGTPVLQVHAPGTVVLAVPVGSRRLTGQFGLRPPAYLDGGATDGVGFSLEIESADGARQTVWRRLLQPTTQTADRGPQPFATVLPPGTRWITLCTDPGAGDDVRWDWSYWNRVRFDAGER